MYDELDNESDSSSCNFASEELTNNDHTNNTSLSKSYSYIVHLDVDCFYCQCEEISNPSLATKPLAIGQKHIIVTSNYVARKMGVKKLQGRNDALRVCPSLVIIEGSDLEPYRDASRSIYAAFRVAVQKLHADNAAKKGGMDEYFADITASIGQEWDQEKLQNRALSTPDGVWVYGDDGDSSVVQIREDQSGATSTSVFTRDAVDAGRWGSEEERNTCMHKLRIAAGMARRIQDEVKSATSFSTTMGISVSPMLAKLASELKKPNSCNILYPWRALRMIDTMPLRRIPDLGSRTLRSIIPALKQYNGEKDPDFWTCRDLLNVPRHAIQSCLEKDKDGSLYDLLINRCKGIDPIPIIDDGGGLTKTVSVEDSFIRGSLTSMEKIKINLDVLLVRILRLLDKRKEASPSPQNAFPRAIRLTARIVDHSVESRRPFRNVSKQSTFHGKVMMEMQDNDERIAMLRRNTVPLLHMLTDLTVGLNVTRLNLATVSFADVELAQVEGKNSGSKEQKDVSSYFQSNGASTSQPQSNEPFSTDSVNMPSNMPSNSSNGGIPSLKRGCMQDVITALKHKQHAIKNKSKTALNCNPSNLKRKHDRIQMDESTKSSHCTSSFKQEQEAANDHQEMSPHGMDPSVFAALPPDIAKEVLANQSFHRRPPPKKKVAGIQQFFSKK